MIEPITVLIIDDDAAVRYLTKRSLINYDTPIQFSIREATNGMEGLEELSTANPLPHIVLVDINMPVMDGYEFLDAYDQLTLSTDYKPAIYVVSTVTAKLPNKAQKLVKGQFEKPLTEDHIKIILSSL
jgi:CheY-like chemotaxis protein